MRIIWLMENMLAAEAEAKYLLAGRDRTYERSLKKELLTILEEAEFWYGPRDSSYEVQEPLISECTTANVVVYPFWFARIYLSNNSRIDRQLASAELSHEAIHILSPSYFIGPTVLEEGLATYFSFNYVNRVHGLGWEKSYDPKYEAARQGVSILLAKNEFAIKELRAREPVISKIGEKLLVEVAGIEPALAKFLSADFQSYGQKPSSWTERTKQDAQVFINGFRSIWKKWKST